MTASRFTRTSDGAVLAHLRYQFDGANNLELRQFLHRAGKADSFSYDNGERVSRAQVGGFFASVADLKGPLYQRNYAYQSNGLDHLVSAPLTGTTSSVPPFASVWSGHDAFLLPGNVDGFTRSADPMGRAALAELRTRLAGTDSVLPIAANIVHNGRGDLVRVERGDGIVIENSFQPGGLRFLRRVMRSSSLIELRHYVYDDQGRLLEDYERSGTAPKLVGRYYYANDDAPVAADLIDPASGQLRRFYYLRDGANSIVALADADGNVVERVWYDTFGQPAIEQRDRRPPVLRSVMGGQSGSLLIALSESVWKRFDDPGAGTGIVPNLGLSVPDLVTVSLNATNLGGTSEWVSSLPGYPPYSVIRFTPSQPLPSGLPGGLVSWWPADASVQDVGGGHNGTLRGGATTGPGLVQQAFLLNGTSAFIEISNAQAFNFGTNDLTVSVWVNFNRLVGEQVLIEKWIQAQRAGWSLLKRTNNTLSLAIGDGAGNEFDVDSGPLALGTNSWIHFTARRQRNSFTIFTNGVAVGAGAASANLDSTASLKFGSREGTASFLNGSIDEVVAFSRALSDAELSSVAGGASLPGPVTVTLNAGQVVDEWGNSNATSIISFQVTGVPGTVYYFAEPDPQTTARRLAQSSVGSPFLFHGQYFDYHTGLIYLRARFYDPFSGMFFEPDPMGYEDSVNLYAGMGNNPASNRDPTGLASWSSSQRGVWNVVAGEERAVAAEARVARTALNGPLEREMEHAVNPAMLRQQVTCLTLARRS